MARAVKAPPSVQWARFGLVLVALVWLLVVLPLTAVAAPYAALVMDARTGEVLHTDNADARLHPASLTKMMTLYIAFEAIEHGEIGVDDLVTISANAAKEPPSKLGMRAGQKIRLRYLIRAAAVKSANDAATAIGEAISGSEKAFAARMNRTAKALGMTRTTFQNAHGLTAKGHLSTARDMSILGRHLLYDYPAYYSLFKRTTVDVGGRTLYHTNRRFLRDYAGADGIKTGYTSAAGFNLTASALRGKERIIVTVFGGTSTAARNKKVAALMDLGFKKAPSRVAVRRTSRPPYQGNAGISGGQNYASISMTKSLRPVLRPLPQDPIQLAGLNNDIATALALAAQEGPLAEGDTEEPTIDMNPLTPRARPLLEAVDTSPAVAASLAAVAPVKPKEPRVVSRNLSDDKLWGINVGRFGNRHLAERALVTTALKEIETLQGAERQVAVRSTGYDANFMGLTRDTADLACRRLQARNMNCFMVGPS
ncbi:D-alanyl-D-alanine carboxypeptidase family protein [Donghicola sp.]|uniref:D-alanyl-D-alanine carboxypeptidase family protein n=1 Tax=Donghicola sp. TaxID=1929294 RepID=UPI0025DAF766|nr:D-alanyl-D-alanine carboxypeptidase family protein [Donghicola sp.]MCT4578290.1 D-alanyl-D-alanine carboxypeptidase [Donghicola sp.]